METEKKKTRKNLKRKFKHGLLIIKRPEELQLKRMKLLKKIKTLQKTKTKILNYENDKKHFLINLLNFIDNPQFTLDEFHKLYPEIINTQVSERIQNSEFSIIAKTVPTLSSLTNKTIIQNNELKWQIGECAKYYYLDKQQTSTPPHKITQDSVIKFLKEYNPKVYVIYQSKEIFNILNKIKEMDLTTPFVSISNISGERKFIPSPNLKKIFEIGSKLLDKGLTEIDLTGYNVDYVYCENCNGLTELIAPKAYKIEIKECNNLIKVVNSSTAQVENYNSNNTTNTIVNNNESRLNKLKHRKMDISNLIS